MYIYLFTNIPSLVKNDRLIYFTVSKVLNKIYFIFSSASCTKMRFINKQDFAQSGKVLKYIIFASNRCSPQAAIKVTSREKPDAIKYLMAAAL